MSKKKKLGLKDRLRDADGDERGAILSGLPYEVGFGKPPQNTRFAAGNQAGTRGRPKGSENLNTIVREEFDAKIEVTEGGKPRLLSKRRIGVRQVANKVASGDVKAFSIYLELLRKTGQLEQPQTGETLVLEPRDLEAVERLSAFLGGAETAEPAKTTEGAS
jgi:hypothetical protein